MVFIKSLGDLDTVGSEFNQDDFEIPVNRDPNLRGKNKHKIDMTCVILMFLSQHHASLYIRCKFFY